MPWPSLLTLFDFSGSGQIPIKTLLGETTEPVWSPFSLGAGQQSHLPLVVLEALVSCPCAGTGPALAAASAVQTWHTLYCAEPVVPSASCETESNFGLSLGFLFHVVMRCLRLSCTPWQSRRVQGTAGPWMSPFFPVALFVLPFPFYSSLPRYPFFFSLFQHGFPKKFFNQSNLRQKIGFVTPGPGIV